MLSQVVGQWILERKLEVDYDLPLMNYALSWQAAQPTIETTGAFAALEEASVMELAKVLK